jgi:hypothetical protein
MRSPHLGLIAGEPLRGRPDRALKDLDPNRDLIDPDAARSDIMKIDSRGKRRLTIPGSERIERRYAAARASRLSLMAFIFKLFI